jgi:hypothetical protein
MESFQKHKNYNLETNSTYYVLICYLVLLSVVSSFSVDTMIIDKCHRIEMLPAKMLRDMDNLVGL